MNSRHLLSNLGEPLLSERTERGPSLLLIRQRNGVKLPLRAVSSVGASMCAPFSLLCSLQPHTEMGGWGGGAGGPTRILCVVGPEPGLWVLGHMPQRPAPGLIQQLGHAHSLLRATGMPCSLLPSPHWQAHLLERTRQLFVPRCPKVTVITQRAQNAAAWQRHTANVVPGQARPPGRSVLHPQTHGR